MYIGTSVDDTVIDVGKQSPSALSGSRLPQTSSHHSSKNALKASHATPLRIPVSSSQLECSPMISPLSA
jgi:hypothetical protein